MPAAPAPAEECPFFLAQAVGPSRRGEQRLLLDHDSSMRINKDMISISILASDQVITICIAPRGDHLIAGHPLQCNGCLEILPKRRIGTEGVSRANRRSECRDAEKHLFFHGLSNSELANQSLLMVVGSMSTDQIASRDEEISLARRASPLCSKPITFCSSVS